MRTFLFVLSFILILFGISIWYYRSGSEGGSPLSRFSFPFFGSKQEEKGGEILSQNSESFKSLEIVESMSGRIDPGQKRVYFAVGKTENEGSVSVPGTWYLSDNSVGSLNSTEGSETTFSGAKEGKTILYLSYRNLKAEKEIGVGGAVLGSRVTPSPTSAPTVTPKPSPATLPASTTTAAPRPTTVNIYDPDGRRIVVGDQRNFVARVVFSDGRERNVDVTWSLSGDLGTLSRTGGTNTDFKALKMGSGLLKASYQGISGTLSIQVN